MLVPQIASKTTIGIRIHNAISNNLSIYFTDLSPSAQNHSPSGYHEYHSSPAQRHGHLLPSGNSRSKPLSYVFQSGSFGLCLQFLHLTTWTASIVGVTLLVLTIAKINAFVIELPPSIKSGASIMIFAARSSASINRIQLHQPFIRHLSFIIWKKSKAFSAFIAEHTDFHTTCAIVLHKPNFQMLRKAVASSAKSNILRFHSLHLPLML